MSTFPTATTMVRGLSLLQEASSAARAVGCDAWQFAVEIDEFKRAGVAHALLRWLLALGFVEQRVETTRRGATCRSFRPAGGLGFDRRSCFVLTAQGDGLAAAPDGTEAIVTVQRESAAARGLWTAKPVWDGQARKLCCRGHIVKHYRVPAPAQELILVSLHEQDWPDYIDDPLPPIPGIDPRTRLHDTLKRLNRNQVNRVLRFGGDGTGKRLTWQILDRV
jgi:hypothetical protein